MSVGFDKTARFLAADALPFAALNCLIGCLLQVLNCWKPAAVSMHRMLKYEMRLML